jgi:N-dimethylarginine dimethylaminohydrolase
MKKILIMELPKKNNDITGCWYNGYPLHKGGTEESLNIATVYSNKHKIIPNQEIITKQHKDLIEKLKIANYSVEMIEFPEELNQIDCLGYDAVFVRDSGFLFKNYWIKANFSVKARSKEIEIVANIIKDRFNKKIITPPENACIEFGEVHYIETKNGSYYFGGISRANRLGHEFVKDIIKPDNYLIIKSNGFHLDTVFCPVLNKENELCALLVAKNMIDEKSYEDIKKLGIRIIDVDNIDSSGDINDLGNYSVNGIISPGYLINSSKFITNGVEEELKRLGILRCVVPLTYFRFAGGSCHCLTNEFIE